MWKVTLRRLSVAGGLLLLAGGFSLPALAQAPTDTSPPVDTAPAAEPTQVPLTPGLVENFLASWPDMEALRQRFDQSYGSDDAEDEGDPLFSLGNYLEKPDAKAEIDKTLAKYSFASFGDWANVAESVMLAFGAADPDAGPVDVDAEKKRVTDEINNDTSLSAEEKQQALKDLDEQFAAMADFEPLPGNVDVVKPYMDKIRTLFEGPPQ